MRLQKTIFLGIMMVLLSACGGDSGGSDSENNVPPASSSTLSTGLVAHYEFEGNAKDSSGNGNDGVEHGGMGYTDGVIGQAGSFDGVDDYIRVKHNDILNLKNMTLSAWVYDYEHIGSSMILLKGRWTFNMPQERQYEFSSSYGETDVANFGILNTNETWEFIKSKNDIPLQKWTHILVSYDGFNQKMYINGNLVNSRNKQFNNFIPNNPSDLMIGAAISTKEQEVVGVKNGLIDDLRIYNRSLNETEIAELYKMRQ